MIARHHDDGPLVIVFATVSCIIARSFEHSNFVIIGVMMKSLTKSTIQESALR
jgi:hypothetical protein